MDKIMSSVLAGAILIASAAASALAAGTDAAVQSAANSSSPRVVLALAAGHSLSNISRSSAVVVPNAKIRIPQQCMRACGRPKSASPEVFDKGMLRKVDACRPEC
jgi:hypothetical protein